MKKNKSIFLLSFICFTCLTNAQCLNTDGYTSNSVQIVITNAPDTSVHNFSISMINIPNEISQLDTMTLDICIQNNSSYIIPDDCFFLDYIHTDGFSVKTSTCEKNYGGLGGVKIPPLPPGESTLISEGIKLPHSQNGEEHFLSLGYQSFDFYLYKVPNWELKAKTNLHFNVFDLNQQTINNCKSLSKTPNVSLPKVSTHPNPFISEVIFDISKQNFVFPISLELYNSKGILEDSRIYIEDHKLEKLQYNNSVLSAGIYYYKLISQNNVVTGTLIRK